jgi:glycosyltransferase involved in cell wall biosynthesis
MNILFVYTSEIIPENGGVQRVTKVLADHFEENKINIFYLSKHKSTNNSLKNHYFLPDNQNENNQENLNYIRTLVLENKINIIINQAALGGNMGTLCYEAKKVADIKIISVIHNSLLGNLDNFTSLNKKIFNVIPVSLFSTFLELNFFKKLLLIIYIFKYKNKYKKLYNHSDKIILLSDSYFAQFKLFVKNAISEKVISIYNPCGFKNNFVKVEKKNELLFVGRVNITQKRVDILLEIWRKIFLNFPDWKLNIVGDGEDLNYLKNKAIKMKLERVFFLGYKDPINYYKSAKIFCMTSGFEGFPLVLAEAQNFNVIPILFNSFPSAKDIINNKNGILIEPFNIDLYVNNLKNLMINYDTNIKSFKSEFQLNKNKFSIHTIGSQWLSLFNELMAKNKFNEIE